MNVRIIQLKRVTKAILLVLLLNVVGMTKVYAVTIGDLNYDLNNNSLTATITSHKDGTNATGSLTIPSTVTYTSQEYINGQYVYVTRTYAVTEISGYYIYNNWKGAFQNCSGLTGNLTIPNTVTLISTNAFRGCSGFTGDLAIPNSVTSIGSYAFYGCNGFTGSLTVPSSVTTLGRNAFCNCSGFTDVYYNIPNCSSSGYMDYINNSWIWLSPFAGCGGSLTIGNNVETIPKYMFSGGGFSGNLIIGNSVNTIDIYAFSNCSGFTGSLTIPNSVTSIGQSAFYNCSGFTGSLTISNAMNSIENYVFSGCSGFTGSLTISNSVNAIGSRSFSGCSGFESLTIGNSVTTIGSFAFENCSGFSGGLIIPNSVTTIEDRAFYNCSGFTGTLTIGNSVTTIHVNAFMNCSGFTGLHYNAANCAASGGSPFTSCGGVLAIGDDVEKIPAWMFSNCSGFTGNLTIPNSVTTIGNGAFSGCSGFTGNLTIPNSVTTIGNAAFSGCSGFTGNLTIPNSVTTIGSEAFYNCNHFTGNLIIPNSVTMIGSSAFRGCSRFNGNLTIPNSVISIDIFAFYGCMGFTGSLTIPNSVTTIGGYAFYGCSHFAELTIGEGVTTIGDHAFWNCPALVTVHFNATNCTQMYSVSNSSYYSVFSKSSSYNSVSPIVTLTIGDNVTSVPDYAFAKSPNLTSLTIGNSVATIGNYAFSNYNSLTSISIHAETPPTIESFTFSNCPKSIPVYVPCGSVEAYQSASYWNQFTNIQEVCTQAQTINLGQGWNWFSTYIEADDLLQQLEASLGENGLYIESSELLSTEYLDGEWLGDLEEVGITNEQLYLVQTSATCTIQLQGLKANPANHVITIHPEWNWVGYPCSEEMTISEALSGFVPEDGDRIENMEDYAEYLDGEWLGLETLKPGEGFLYYSNSATTKTFTFPVGAK